MEICMNETADLEYLGKKYQLSKRLLLDSNPFFENEKIFKGEKIVIPGWGFVQNNPFHPSPSLTKNTYNAVPISWPVIDPKRPYHFFALTSDIKVLKKNYPFIKERIIGRSVLGNPLVELLIGSGTKKVHMNGSFHANEWITTAIMMKWLNEYVRKLILNESINGISVRQLYEQITLSFVPMVNPDGVNLVLAAESFDPQVKEQAVKLNNNCEDFSDWKANIRGVDLNNQFPAFWEIEKERKSPKSPAPRDYPGDYPLSEPEAIAMSELVKQSQFELIVAFHTQGEEIYWGYLNYEPEKSEEIVKEYELLSGYKGIRMIDSHAGFRDWFIKEYRKPGFTVELGRGRNPLPLDQFDEIYRKAKGIFWASLYLLCK